MKTSRLLIAATLASAFLASGCATDNFRKSREEATSASATANKAFSEIVPERKLNVVTENPGFWVSKKVVDSSHRRGELPEIFQSRFAMAYEPRATLRSIARTVSRATGLQVTFTQDAAASSATPIYNNSMKVEERLIDVLDQATQMADLSWRYINGGVEIFDTETRTFHIAAVPGTSEFTAKLGTKNTGGAGTSANQASQISSDSGQSLTIKNTIDFWKSVREEVQQQVGPRGKFVVSEASGIVTVTDSPRNLSRIEKYFKDMNSHRIRQVMVSVKLYSVTTSAKDNYSLDWSMIYKNLNQYAALGMRGANYATQAAFNPATGQITLARAAATGSTGLNFMILDDGTKRGGFYGSDVLLQAMSSQGAASLVTEAVAITTSGEPVPLNITKETSYLAAITTTAVSGGTSQSSLTPGVVTTGFSMNLLPKLMPNDGVSLQAAIDLSSLDRMAEITSSGQTIQIPEKSGRSFMQKVHLRSGQTLVIGGFQQTGNQFGTSGVGSVDMNPAGGSRTSDRSKTTLILTMTPIVVHPGDPDKPENMDVAK